MKAEGRARAEEIRTDPVKRWFEEHQKFTSELADGLKQALCVALLSSAIVTTTPIEGSSGSLVPQTGIGGSKRPATINQYNIIGGLPGAVQPQLPSLGGGIRVEMVVQHLK